MFSYIITYTPSEDVDYEEKGIKEHLEIMFDREKGFPSGYKCYISKPEIDAVKRDMINLIKNSGVQLEDYDIFTITRSVGDWGIQPITKSLTITKKDIEEFGHDEQC